MSNTPHDFNKEPISRKLRELGFSGLEDKAVLEQMGVCVRDHNHFRSLLLCVTPDKRTTAYEALRAHLTFTAKPLHEYESEGAMLAEQAKLPVWNEKNQTVTDYADYHGGRTKLEVLAMSAIKRAAQEEKCDKNLLLTCAKCTVQAMFPALDRLAAYSYARKSGWWFDKDEDGKEVAVCPECPAARVEMVLA